VSDRIRFQIAMARRILAREGCESMVAGHVSVRAAGEDAFWVTPFEYFDETVPERVIKCSFDMRLLEGDWEPSPSITFHAEFYKGRPDISSIVHTHAHHTMVFATTGRVLGIFNDMSSLFLDEQVVYVEDGVKPPVDGKLMCEASPGRHVVIIKNHGAIFLGESLENATIEALTFEKCARIQIEAEAVGGTEHARAYAEQSKQAYRQYYRPQMWAAAVRRLRRDDPAFFVGFPAGEPELASPSEVLAR
jgi:L-fuculose-phosphate aldolase